MKNLVICILMSAGIACAAPFVPPPRNPAIETPPRHARGGGTPTNYTTYELKLEADRQQAIKDVERVASNNSFVSRLLQAISNRGESKRFYTITGEDGLTFGIKDFTSGSVLPLLSLIEERFPGEVNLTFGDVGGKVLDQAWLGASPVC